LGNNVYEPRVNLWNTEGTVGDLTDVAGQTLADVDAAISPRGRSTEHVIALDLVPAQRFHAGISICCEGSVEEAPPANCEWNRERALTKGVIMTNIESNPALKSGEKTKGIMYEDEPQFDPTAELDKIYDFTRAIWAIVEGSQQVSVGQLLAAAPELDGYDRVELILNALDGLESERLISLSVQVDASTSASEVIASLTK
jgi:hypothetical protein